MKLYTSGSDKNGCILGKWKPFRVKQKVFPTESKCTQMQWNNPLSPEMHKNSRTLNILMHVVTQVQDLDQQWEWVFIWALIPCLTKHGISTQVEHLKKPLTQIDQRSVHQCFTWLKPSKRETVHPSQCGHLRQYINAKEKIVHKSFSQSIFNK
jgi:hypothetical protein